MPVSAAFGKRDSLPWVGLGNKRPLPSKTKQKNKLWIDLVCQLPRVWCGAVGVLSKSRVSYSWVLAGGLSNQFCPTGMKKLGRSLPELKLGWRRRRTWGSIGSAGCLSICCRQHTLQNSTGQSPAAHPTARPPQHTDSRLRGNLVLNVTSASLPCDPLEG